MGHDIRTRLAEFESALLAAKRRPLCGDAKWAHDVTPSAGVYIIWEKASGKPVYVGETSALLARMGDLGRTVNHTFRRIARKKCGAASSSESDLSAILAARYEIAFMPVDFGRAEIEEYLILRFRKTLYNKPALRLQRSAQYEWVKQAD